MSHATNEQAVEEDDTNVMYGLQVARTIIRLRQQAEDTLPSSQQPLPKRDERAVSVRTFADVGDGNNQLSTSASTSTSTSAVQPGQSVSALTDLTARALAKRTAARVKMNGPRRMAELVDLLQRQRCLRAEVHHRYAAVLQRKLEAVLLARDEYRRACQVRLRDDLCITTDATLLEHQPHVPSAQALHALRKAQRAAMSTLSSLPSSTNVHGLMQQERSLHSLLVQWTRVTRALYEESYAVMLQLSVFVALSNSESEAWLTVSECLSTLQSVLPSIQNALALAHQTTELSGRYRGTADASEWLLAAMNSVEWAAIHTDPLVDATLCALCARRSMEVMVRARETHKRARTSAHASVSSATEGTNSQRKKARHA